MASILYHVYGQLVITTILTTMINASAEKMQHQGDSLIKEATELIELGYEYVCDMEKVKLFRKPK